MSNEKIKRRSFCFDLECYQNFFSAVFIHINSDAKREFIIFNDPRDPKLNINQFNELMVFVQSEVLTLIGYNNRDYDDMLLKHLLNNIAFFKTAKPLDINTSLKGLSDKIINQEKRRGDDEAVSSDPYLDALRQRKYFGSMDLMQQFNTVKRIPLKQLAINMRWPQIIDLPYEPSHIVVHEEIAEIMYYNDNDVQITKRLLEEREELVTQRRNYTKENDVNVLNANDTTLARTVIRKFYSEVTGIKFEEYRNKRTLRPVLRLSDCVSRKVKFMTADYQKALNYVRNHKPLNTMQALKEMFRTEVVELLDGTTKTVHIKEKQPNKSFEYIFRSKYITHTVGLGGIHSNNVSEIIQEDGEHELIDADVASYYPSIIVKEGLYPGHLGPKFVEVYRDKIYNQRLEAKAKGEKVIADTLKISLNSTFGLTKSAHSWLYDPHVTFFITISGQLFLLMLMERIEFYTDAKVVYSNTDGITCKVPKDQKELFYSICKQWQAYTGFGLEFQNFKRMVIRDVNNFLMVTYDKKKPVKVKGVFMNAYVDRPTPDWIALGYSFPIIAKALQAYYSKNVNPEVFIKQQTDIYDFMRAERTSPKSYTVTFEGRDGKAVVLQKNNRWIVTKGNEAEGYLRKTSIREIIKGKPNKRLGKTSEMQKDRLVTVLNDMTKPHANISMYKLDYDFYLTEIYKVIKTIKVRNGRMAAEAYTQMRLI
jgi:hypothetical protein